MSRTQIDPSLTPTIYTLAKQLAFYRRPRIIWASVTSVGMERGLTLTGGTTAAVVVFPDGEIRTTTSVANLEMLITRNAVLTSVTQGGLRTGLSETNNTWYYLYAVKTTNTNSMCLVGDIQAPSRGAIPALDGFYGANSWIYLGSIRNGDASAVPGDILSFEQAGAEFIFTNIETAISGNEGIGMRLAAAASTSVSWVYDPDVVPGTTIHIGKFWFGVGNGGATAEWTGKATTSRRYFDYSCFAGNRGVTTFIANPALGFVANNASPGSGQDINLYGWTDSVLVGGNWSVNGGD